MGGSSRTSIPQAVVGQLGVVVGDLRDLLHGHGVAFAGAVGVERLAVGDGEHPGAQVRVRSESGIGTHRGHEGLLKAVVGVGPPDRGDQEAPHVVAVVLQEPLEGREHGHTTDILACP